MELANNILSFLGGLCLFLFGMHLLGEGLERRAGKKLRTTLGKLTDKPLRGLLLGAGVTALVQSSSAVTVMTVGFVNSGVLTLRQAVGVIMGANVGTTATAWLLGLTQLQGGFLLSLFNPAVFSPILALIGIGLFLSSKQAAKRDLGLLFLSFTTLMFGMETMTDAMKPLAGLPWFGQILLWFQNPPAGVLLGAVMTAILQSSSASVGVLQALTSTGGLTVGSVIPIVMGQNVGTCVTTLLSSVGAGRSARRAAMVHLYFNLIGSGFFLTAFWLSDRLLSPALFAQRASAVEIAVIHTVFNLLCVIFLFPFAGWLERLTVKTVSGEDGQGDKMPDIRLLATPSAALEESRRSVGKMALLASENLNRSLSLLERFDEDAFQRLNEEEQALDRMEDEIGSYLLRVGSRQLGDGERREISMLLHLIGDFERIGDHAVNLGEAAMELDGNGETRSPKAWEEMSVLFRAVQTILSLAVTSFLQKDRRLAAEVEPLEEVVDGLYEELHHRYVERLQADGQGSVRGITVTGLLTDLERVADHCSNVAGRILTEEMSDPNIHAYLHALPQNNPEAFQNCVQRYRQRFALP